MADDVQRASLGSCRAWVDARRNPGLFSCARTELREHTLRSRRAVGCTAPDPCVSAPRAARPETHEHRPIAFGRFLKRQNLEHAEPAMGPPALARPQERPPSLPRPDVPRLGDVTPVGVTAKEVRLRVTYKVEVPLRLGRVIDLFA